MKRLSGGKKGITRSSARTKEPRKHKNEVRGDEMKEEEEKNVFSVDARHRVCVGDQTDLFPTPPKREG